MSPVLVSDRGLVAQAAPGQFETDFTENTGHASVATQLLRSSAETIQVVRSSMARCPQYLNRLP